MDDRQTSNAEPGDHPDEERAYIGIVTGLSRGGNQASAALAPDARAEAALKAAAAVFGFDAKAFQTKPRGRHPAGRARQCAVAVFMEVTGAGPSEAAKAFGIDESTARTARTQDAGRVDAVTGSARAAVRSVLEALFGEGAP